MVGLKMFFRKTKDTSSGAVTSATLTGAAIASNKVVENLQVNERTAQANH